MKLAIGLENFKGVFALKHLTSDNLSLASVEINRNYLLSLPQWKCLCHRGSHDQPQPGSFFQRPREAEKRDPGNEVGNYVSFTMYEITSQIPRIPNARIKINELMWTRYIHFETLCKRPRKILSKVVSCSVASAIREPKSISSHESNLSQPRVNRAED